MKVLFLRHGQTETNVKAAVHRTDDETALNEAGRYQAKALAKRCRAEGVRQIVASPERRARQTAEIIAAPLGLKVEVLPELSERSWGDWAGKPWADIEAKLHAMDLNERYNFVPPGGESWRQMEHRLRIALDNITASQAETVAVVTHGGALRALMPILKNQPKETSFTYDFQNASIAQFEYNNGRWESVSEDTAGYVGK